MTRRRTSPTLVIWHWKDDRLQPMQQVQENADKNFSFLSALDAGGEEVRPAGRCDHAAGFRGAPEHRFALGMDIREYEMTSNLDGKRYEDIYKVDLKTGERKLALRKARWFMGPSPDGTHFLYYDDGAFFSYDLTSGQQHNLTKQIPSVFIDTEDDHNVVKPPTRRWDGRRIAKYVLLSDSWDIWKVPADGGPAVNLTGNGKKDKIRYRQIFPAGSGREGN